MCLRLSGKGSTIVEKGEETMSRIKFCRACQSDNVEQFFDLGMQPFANALVKSEEEEEKKYPLSLSYCKRCGLVQLDYTADPEELFSNYFWVTSTSSTAREYAEQFCENAMKRVGHDVNYVLEAASNDGTFLKPFINRKVEVLGVDPAQNIAQMANESGVNTRVDFFSKEVAEDIVATKGQPNIVFARNVLPHVANLHSFVKGLKKCTGDESLLILEVHYSGKIMDELHYDSIYHEHLCYFTLKSLTNLLNQYGLYPYDIEKSPISGGSIVVYIKNKPQEKTDVLTAFEKMEEEHGYNEFEKWKDFAHRSFKHKELLNELINNELKNDSLIIGYGASARSSTMLNFCEIDCNKIKVIADQNELKQGYYTPGTKIKIVEPQEALSTKPDAIILLAWNFKNEIINILRREYKYKGKIIVPLPFPPHIEEID